MLAYITGILTEATPHKIAVEVNGLGYGIFIPHLLFEKLPHIGKQVKMYISTIIREDSQKMFGFLTANDRDFFETLNEISGIGPRLALSILGHMTMDDLYLAVENANTKAIATIPGIGKKMAERLVLELRDKFPKMEKKELFSQKQVGVSGDAISALINLGYNPLDAQKAVKKILSSQEKEPSLPELISLALKVKK